MANEEVRICRLSEYIEYIETLPNGFTISRGHSKKTYDLLPGALRVDSDGNRRYSKRLVAHFLEEFKVNSHNYLEFPWDIKNETEWMVMAQHYGLPTKLLDFTDSHSVSLLFAVENAFKDDSEDGEVIFINPSELNNMNCNISRILNINELEKINLENVNGAVAIKMRKLNVRMTAQSGMFLYFHDVNEGKYIDEKCINRVTISAEGKKDILSSLYMMGIGKTQIYPELASVAEDILMKDSIKEYLRGKEE